MNDDTTRINAVTPKPTHQITLKIEEDYMLA